MVENIASICAEVDVSKSCYVLRNVQMVFILGLHLALRGFKCRQILAIRSYMGSAVHSDFPSGLLWLCTLGSSLSSQQQPQLTMQVSLRQLILLKA